MSLRKLRKMVHESTRVGPHQWTRKSLFNGHQCQACLRPKSQHPTTGWELARPL
ncbi:MAG TPA: hypothetical protein VG246_13085 [Acidimicrobiales bacterium]|jgi:hypothetical protein|nr:hypothetical protein [Acidimicrobiales bacterium]